MGRLPAPLVLQALVELGMYLTEAELKHTMHGRETLSKEEFVQCVKEHSLAALTLRECTEYAQIFGKYNGTHDVFLPLTDEDLLNLVEVSVRTCVANALREVA
jgi:hypothetical protein